MPARFSLRFTRILTIAVYLVSHGALLAARPLGIDVSTYQPDTSMDWPTIKNSAGITFAWAKATEGTTGNDSQYTAHMPNGKAAGIYMGSYHYCHPESNTSASEASHFWGRAATYTKNDGLSLMPMLDVEGAAFSGQRWTTTTTAWCNDWCNTIIADAAAQSVILKPNIYVSACNACKFDFDDRPMVLRTLPITMVRPPKPARRGQLARAANAGEQADGTFGNIRRPVASADTRTTSIKTFLMEPPRRCFKRR